MDKIYFNARFVDIPPENLATFKRLAAEAIETARNAPGTLEYDWFMNQSETICVVHEAFADSDAVIEHTDHMSDLLPKLIALSGRFTFECYGNPSAALTETVDFPEGTAFEYMAGKQSLG